MAIISKPVTLPTSGRALASDVNSDFDTIYNEFNGNIENANVKSNAAIVGTKLDLTTVGSIGTTTPGSGRFTNLVTTLTSSLSGTNISAVTTGNLVVSGVSSLSGTNISSLTVSNVIVNEGVIKGWVNFNGTGTLEINDSYNVSSVVDNGVGDYTVNWNTDFTNANYAITISVSNTGGTGGLIGRIFNGGQASGSNRIEVLSTLLANVDVQNCYCIAIGDQ